MGRRRGRGEAAAEQSVDEFAISGSFTGWNEGGGGDSRNRSLGFAREGDVIFHFFRTDRLEGVRDAREASNDVIYISFNNPYHVLSQSFTVVCRQISDLTSHQGDPTTKQYSVQNPRTNLQIRY